MCAIQRVNGQDKLFKVPFERGMVVGARRIDLSVSRTAILLGFSHSTVSRVYQEWWASIPVELFRHFVESMPRQIEAVLRAKGVASQYEEGVPNVLSTHCICSDLEVRTLNVFFPSINSSQGV